MAITLYIIGGIWGLLGVGNILGMPWTTGSNTLLTIGLIFNMLVFVLPALVVAGIGRLVQQRATP